MSAKQEIIKMITDMSGSYSPYSIFSDWVEMCALAISNGCHLIHDKVWMAREDLYKATAAKYTEPQLDRFAEMFVLLGDALTEELSDVLGEICMSAGMGSKYTGQFFTPFHLSELCAKLSIDPAYLDTDGVIEINEPSSGGGGMIIAACKALQDAGVNYQRRLKVTARDLDWKGVYMTYLQLSLIGCKARVIQGDTLMEPYDKIRTPRDRILLTPAWMGVIT